MTPLHCDSCGSTERDPIMLDVETCSVCGGLLTAIKPQHWGSPQPGRVFARRMQRQCFTSTNKARRKVRPFKFFVPQSDPFWRQT
jgi:hypothetical protein